MRLGQRWEDVKNGEVTWTEELFCPTKAESTKRINNEVHKKGFAVWKLQMDLDFKKKKNTFYTDY